MSVVTHLSQLGVVCDDSDVSASRFDLFTCSAHLVCVLVVEDDQNDRGTAIGAVRTLMYADDTHQKHS